jgi:hypothetical protein
MRSGSRLSSIGTRFDWNSHPKWDWVPTPAPVAYDRLLQSWTVRGSACISWLCLSIRLVRRSSGLKGSLQRAPVAVGQTYVNCAANPPPWYPVPPHQPVAPTPPSKKANLAFYIGGGCPILVVLALATCSVAARSCGHLLSINPVVLGRIIAAANPNLEVIDVNAAKGTTKVRDKNSNKTFYLNLTDATRGTGCWSSRRLVRERAWPMSPCISGLSVAHPSIIHFFIYTPPSSWLNI